MKKEKMELENEIFKDKLGRVNSILSELLENDCYDYGTYRAMLHLKTITDSDAIDVPLEYFSIG